jgi:hypothetical protein
MLNINFIEMCTNYYWVHIVLNLLMKQLVSSNFYLKNFNFTVGLKSTACVVLVRKAADKNNDFF